MIYLLLYAWLAVVGSAAYVTVMILLLAFSDTSLLAKDSGL